MLTHPAVLSLSHNFIREDLFLVVFCLVDDWMRCCYGASNLPRKRRGPKEDEFADSEALTILLVWHNPDSTQTHENSYSANGLSRPLVGRSNCAVSAGDEPASKAGRSSCSGGREGAEARSRVCGASIWAATSFNVCSQD